MTHATIEIEKVFTNHQKKLSDLIGNNIVEVYKNLHKNCWSVRSKGKVILHTDSICLEGVSLVVRETGRQRVILEKRKNVHAFIKGNLSSIHKANRFAKTYDPHLSWSSVTYNPYFNGKFVDFNGDNIVSASYVNMFINDGGTYVFALQ